ncbi:aminofutalosine deaminase family hydrolase [Campylobacter mucosalis]|uniref:aminofutalosine deaminase family hydrolase n=1 Tax=Campylobacter mucosalis TaxID=202 RepID=UPI0014707411|nr:metal-dependent hydrolase [Campylobacter mucosalis]
MKILKSKFILTCDENFKILKDKAIAFDKKIIAIDEVSNLVSKFKNAKILDFGNVIITPALINTHVHLEFSSNISTLKYGDFIEWLGSIIDNGHNLKCSNKIMQNALNSIISSGVGTIGAVSSFGSDLEIAGLSEARVVFFNEILGSNPDFIEQNMSGFLERFFKSHKFKSERFIPAISLHSPYSIHPNLAKKAVKFAKNENLIVSTHFLESSYEKMWLEKGKGGFKNHLKRFVADPKPMYDKSSYLGLFSGLRTLFTHCVYQDDFSGFDPKFHSVTHCASSNRLLGKKALNIGRVLANNISLNIGTDGLSSNISLNMFDELRNALFTHQNIKLNDLSKILFTAATSGGAKALGLNNGTLKSNKDADIAVFEGFDDIDESSVTTQLILHTKRAKALFVLGKQVI